jgi:hypothetical protein
MHARLMFFLLSSRQLMKIAWTKSSAGSLIMFLEGIERQLYYSGYVVTIKSEKKIVS